ncbi:HAMP domain-containing sensor histidine kinase [Nocardioides koreensis]|uniref:histidine kinase n=1 Tax=Nocardioides koreensis TaxID=433651 RepID=A0ABP5L843_9ACTN
MRSPFASLTSRLVLTAVALVAVVCLLIATATTLAMRSSLMDRLDRDVRSSVLRAGDNDNDHDEAGPPRPPLDSRYQGPGTLIASIGGGTARGFVNSEERAGSTPLSTSALQELSAVPTDGGVHGVSLPGFGSYRVTVVQTPDGDRLVTGLPTRDVDATVSSLVGWELLLTLLGVGAAAGAGLVVVRRQLRPLREVAQTAHTVAELPLASGEIDLTERVPEHLTDERTEVGQVGAALNTLLVHVESSLEARHRSEQQVRQFVADASHELRTPLTTIAGYTELARRRPGDAGTALGKVEEESGRMTALVEDLLLLARLDAGRPLEREPVDLTRLLLEAVSDARVVAPDHRWRLDLPDDAVEVTGDAHRLHQVVTNLLTNARKYTPAGTTVTVSARRTPDGGSFAVHDDGPGFPPDLVEHAFERFARGDVARTRASGDGEQPVGGAGLGLSLVQAIVHAHGGRVSLTSHPRDTTITVSLPG